MSNKYVFTFQQKSLQNWSIRLGAAMQQTTHTDIQVRQVFFCVRAYENTDRITFNINQ